MEQFTTLKEMAAQLAINVATLRRWLRRTKVIVPRGRICPEKQAEILTAITALKMGGEDPDPPAASGAE
jgi:phage antirepressor YoqD-like protein